MEIFTDFEALEVRQQGDVKTLVAKNRVDGTVQEFSAEALMIATGRVSNADLLKPEKTGVKLDDHGFIVVNEYLETSKKHIYAFGDAIGKRCLNMPPTTKRALVWHNSTHDHKVKMDYSATPHAVFYASPNRRRRLKTGRSESAKLQIPRWIRVVQRHRHGRRYG